MYLIVVSSQFLTEIKKALLKLYVISKKPKNSKENHQTYYKHRPNQSHEEEEALKHCQRPTHKIKNKDNKLTTSQFPVAMIAKLEMIKRTATQKED